MLDGDALLRSYAMLRALKQKATYLLECAMSLGVFREHGRKTLGPYDSAARYKDAEPIACKKGWLEVEGSTLRVPAGTDDWRRFAGRYLRSESLAKRFVDYLARFSDAELETMATVHSSVMDIAASPRLHR